MSALEDVRQAWMSSSYPYSVAIPTNLIKSANVVRRNSTYDGNGDLLVEDYQEVMATHNIALWPLSYRQQIENSKFGISASHNIRPLAVIGSFSVNDFYQITGKKYRIIEVKDFYNAKKIVVWDGLSAEVDQPQATTRSFVIDNLGPGIYVYGSGLLTGMGPFLSRPLLLETLMNDGDGFFANTTVAGFEIVDTGEGAPPIYTVTVKGILA